MLYTIGHSNRSREQFLELLQANNLGLLVDVRQTPASGRFPHFNKKQLKEQLGEHGIRYTHREELGGRRGAPEPDSPNDAWQEEAFRAYADYLGKQEPRQILAELASRASQTRIAVMCAEADPYRCHRRLIADVWSLQGYEVWHITGIDASHMHQVSPSASMRSDGSVIWPSAGKQQPLSL